MSFKNLIKYNNKIIEGVYLFAIIIIPLVFSPEELFGFYQLPKEYLLHLSSSILLILIGIKIIFEPSKVINKINSNKLALSSVFLILFSYLISSIFSVNKLGSFFGREYGMSSNSFQTYFALSIIFLSIFIVYENKKNNLRVFKSILISTTLISIIGLLQFIAPNIFKTFTFYHQDRIMSTLGNPIYFGSVLILGIQLSIIYFLLLYKLEEKKGINFAYPLIIISLQISSLLLTLSRGPLISFVIGVTIIFFSYIFLCSKSFKKTLVIFLFPFLISFAIVSIPTFQGDYEYFDSFVERSGSLSKDIELSIDIESGNEFLSPNSFNYRGENWIGAYRLIKSWPTILDNSRTEIKRLFFGYGPDMYIYVYPITVPIQERIVISANAHNLFLNIFVENGLIGISLLIFLIVTFLYISKRKLSVSGNEEKFMIIALLAILFSRTIEQLVGLAVTSDLLFTYSILAIISIKTSNTKKLNFNVLNSKIKNLIPLFSLLLISISVIFIGNNFNKLVSSIYLGNGISHLNRGEIENGVLSLERASRYNKRSEIIETELFKISYKIYQVENKKDSTSAGRILPLMYERLLDFEERSPYSFNTQLFLTHITWEISKRNPELFREESVARYIRLRNLMPQYLGPQEILSNVLVAIGEIELGKNEAELGIKMSDSAGLTSAQSWWVKGEAERVLNKPEDAIESFQNSINDASISTGLEYESEHRDLKFLVLSYQSMGLAYENIDIEKAIEYIQEAIKIAYNTGNVLLLEQRFR